MDEFPSQAFRDSVAWPIFHEVNEQDTVMVGVPMLSCLHGGTVKALQYSHHGDNVIPNGWVMNGDPVLGRVAAMDVLPGSSDVVSHGQMQDLCLGGGSVASTTLTTDEANNLAIPLQQEIPPEYFSAFGSSSCAMSSSSAAVACLDSGSGGILGDSNDKFDESRFLFGVEFNLKAGFHPTHFGETLNSDGWTLANNANVGSNNPCGFISSNNELSLSLPSSKPSVICRNGYGVGCSDTGSDNGREICVSSKSAELCRIILGSRYVEAVQEILSENARYWLEGVDVDGKQCVTDVWSCRPRGSLGWGTDVSPTCAGGQQALCSRKNVLSHLYGVSDAPEVESKKSQLLSLLQMVDEQCTKSLDDIHTVVSAFHAASELDPRIHARFALQTVCALYKNLRDKISSEILGVGSDISDGSGSEKESYLVGNQWSLQQIRRKDQQLWRPQRGLPEKSVSVLRAWMFQNFLHPYPKDAEKHLLAIKSGLSRSQVSNWFINARVRLWKPLIEEMYAEVNRSKGREEGYKAD